MKYICRNCNREYDDSFEGWRCECGHSLWIEREVVFDKSKIDTADFSMWRYDAAYPIKREELASSFGEGLTPLEKEQWDGQEIFIKNDALMPSGSFKDRGVAMMINHLALKGVDKITEDSSGNAGASVAEYAAKANMECNIYVPAGTSKGKISQVLSTGAILHEIEGSRDNTALAAQSGIEGVYASHNWNPYFVEGVKSLAYEIWEQLGFKSPDNIICPIGNGSIAAGLEQGFRELLENKEVTSYPKIYGVQAKNANSMYRKFYGESLEYDSDETIAEGIALKNSSKSDEVVEALKATNGKMIDVSEVEILEALKQISELGYYIEPTSAATFAGVSQLIKNKEISKKDKTVVINTGNGLKASEKIIEYLNL